ncbi:MAG: SMC-Scp complex subunit ScpB [Kiritimatiellae bacterium]|nr:SMC-Scp complex subunit ScpB [Kiritimatiellia bacterium]
MEENLDQEQQQLPEQEVQTAEVKAKAEQYNKPKDIRLPLPGSLQEIVGALLFASESPLSAADIRACVRGVSPEEGDSAEIMEVYKTCTNREIEEALRGLEKALEVAKCGFSLVCTGGQYRMQTTPVCGRYVRALLKLDRPNRLSRASLETLAIVAYRQPITKSEVEQIRGVSVDTIMKTLSDLGLVRLVGRSELPGHPFLYGTTPFFLEHFGLASLDQLNEIDPTLPRSNPRERAKLFKKEEKPVEQTELAAAAAEVKETEKEQQKDEPSAESPEAEASDAEVEVRERIEYESVEDDIDEDVQDEFDEDEDSDDEFDDDSEDDSDDEFDDDDEDSDDDDGFDDEEDEFEDEDEDEFDDEDDEEVYILNKAKVVSGLKKRGTCKL